MTEEWLPIRFTSYEVSSFGRVRNGARILKTWLSDQGYVLVRLSNPRSVERVHRLVASAFVDNKFGKPFVNHIDCDRANNMANNLEWCTQLENLKHSSNLGRMQRDYWKGKRSPNALLSTAQANEIRRIYAQGEMSWERLGKLFEISKRTIGRIVNGESYV